MILQPNVITFEKEKTHSHLSPAIHEDTCVIDITETASEYSGKKKYCTSVRHSCLPFCNCTRSFK
jgi:hypothetical protein